jgi:hypothetical protein
LRSRQAAKDAYFAQREQILKSPLSDARRAQYMKNEVDDQSRSVNEVQRLRNALGDAAFQKVDAYARREILPHIGYQNLRQQQGGKQQWKHFFLCSSSFSGDWRARAAFSLRLMRAWRELRSRLGKHCGRKGPGTFLEKAVYSRTAYARAS